MSKLFAALLAMILSAQSFAAAQWPPLLVSHDDQLSLTATVNLKRPYRVVARLTNLSTHDVLLPKPTQNCGDTRNGTVLIAAMVLSPERDLSGRGCESENFAPPMPVEKRIEGWYRLSPGKSLIYSQELPTKVQRSTSRTRVTYTASYDPPFLSPADRDLLKKARIQVPGNQLSTSWQTITLEHVR